MEVEKQDTNTRNLIKNAKNKYINPFFECIQMDLFSNFPSSISYNNNTEYRDWIRRIFRFNKNAKTYYAELTEKEMEIEIDEESRDEMEFDLDNMQIGLDFLFDTTISSPIFEELYILSAATMFSTDFKIGQSVLCSYDFFYLYYTCLWYFFMDTSRKIETIAEYQKLRSMFRK
jgi:hypothetical protein